MRLNRQPAKRAKHPVPEVSPCHRGRFSHTVRWLRQKHRLQSLHAHVFWETALNCCAICLSCYQEQALDCIAIRWRLAERSMRTWSPMVGV
jgi:hypothetical protein